MLTPLDHALVVAYAVGIAMLMLFGLHRLAMLWLFLTAGKAARARARAQAAGAIAEGAGGAAPASDGVSELPRVTVQVPLYNERYVAERVLRAVAALDYPRDRLEIQALDDSTDETVAIVDRTVATLRGEGVPIVVLRREARAGFKAGALAAGLARARGDLVAVFDADFVPPRGWLRAVVGEFADPGVGLVQTAWGHLNAGASPLTRAQADFLTGHFAIEHTARAAHGCFFNFNGTAGIWRRAAIEEAGGWSADTLTEDLDLSYRAQLAGWRFVYRRDVVVPAELPVEWSAFRNQQRRWTKGAIQVAWKLLPRVWGARGLRLGQRVEATAHLLANLSYVVMCGLALLMGPMLVVRSHAALEWLGALDLATLLLASGSVGAFYVAAQRSEGVGWARAIARVPWLMAVGIALSFNNARAVMGGLLRVQTPFERTAKYGGLAGGNAGAARPRRGGSDGGGGWRELAYATTGGAQNLVEIAAALLFGAVVVGGVDRAPMMTWPIVALFATGLGLAGWWSAGQLAGAWRRGATARRRPVLVPRGASSEAVAS